jgi:hypothetical protein
MSEPPEYRTIVEQLLGDPAVSEAQMMGMPSLKLGAKMFGGLFDGRLVVKIGRERVEQLIAAGRVEPFDPSGRSRPMKDWALVGAPAADWLELAGEAKAFAAQGLRQG